MQEAARFLCTSEKKTEHLHFPHSQTCQFADVEILKEYEK